MSQNKPVPGDHGPQPERWIPFVVLVLGMMAGAVIVYLFHKLIGG